MQNQISNKNNNKKNLSQFEQKAVNFFTDLIIDYILKQEREQKEQTNNEQIKPS